MLWHITGGFQSDVGVYLGKEEWQVQNVRFIGAGIERYFSQVLGYETEGVK